jgi:hypothetical protein
MYCRDFLLVAQDVCHHVAFTPAIEEEWNRHQSGFARRWRRSMFARKKVDRTDCPPDIAFRQALEKAASSEKQKQAMLKDAHLIEAARTQGLRVIALDDIARDYYKQVAVSIAALRGICWVNPTSRDEKPDDWLKSGAPIEKSRTLGGV